MSLKRCGLRPGNPLFGVQRAPASKSLAQRTLVVAALCGEPTIVGGLATEKTTGDDVKRARDLIHELGAELLPHADGTLGVRGLAPGPSRGWRSSAKLQLGESGTLARLATAAAGLCGRPGETLHFEASGSLLARASPALFKTLENAGVRFRFKGRAHGWPVVVLPIGPPSLLELVSPSSSQEVSALLVAASAWPDPIEIVVRGEIPSRPYVEMTMATLSLFGVRIEGTIAGEGESFLVRGPLRAPALPVLVEPDASAAAVLLAAACISGGRISISGLNADSLQGDRRIVEHLRAFGCDAGFDSGGIFAGSKITRGARLDLSNEPDLAPVLAAVAATAALRLGQRSLLSGLGTLQGKESARISVLAQALSALGLSVIATDTTLDVFPGHATQGRLELDSRGDHRMAFAFALLGLARDQVDVLDPDSVTKSWPSFWNDMAAAGASVVTTA